MLCCDPRFRPLLAAFDPPGLENHAGSIVGLWADDSIAYVNPAWYEFSKENGGEPDVSTRWDLGATMTSAISPALLPYYSGALSSCRRTQFPWEHSYECSSAEIFRTFRMKIYPLSADGEVLIVHSLALAIPHNLQERPARDACESDYRGKLGAMYQCAHCRRFRHRIDLERWDWISAWVRQCPADVCQILCPVCRDYYYPEAGKG